MEEWSLITQKNLIKSQKSQLSYLFMCNFELRKY